MSLTDHVLVTGAGGLIGSWCVKTLHEHGISVGGWYKTAPQQGVPWPVHVGDLSKTSPKALADRLKGYNTIVHTAAYLPSVSSELENALAVNRVIDENIVQCASVNEMRLIYLSGTSVYGFADELFTEESKVKLAGIARKYDIEPVIQNRVKKNVILRVSAPYGPNQKSRTVLRIFIENALAGKPLLYYGSGGRQQDFTFVGDIADAVLKCIEQKNVTGIFNITSGDAVNMKSLARIVVDNTGSNSEIRPAGKPDEQEDCKANYSIAKAKKVLGWEPATSLGEGIKKWVTQIINENRGNQ